METNNGNENDSKQQKPNDSSRDGADHDRSMSEIQSDLEHVEQSLQTPVQHRSQGQAAFDSVTSTLSSVRQRLAATEDTAVGPTEAAAAPAAPTPSNTSSSSPQLMDRLETAMLAHSSRIPLGLLRDELDRRQQQQGSSLTQAEGKMEEDNDSKSMSSSCSATRRRSALLASRRRDEQLQQMAHDVRLHEGGSELVLPGVPEPIHEKEAEDESAMQVDEETKTNREVPILLPDKSRSRLRMSHSAGSILGTQAPTLPTAASVVYSWGRDGAQSFHDDAQDRSVAAANVSAADRLGRYTILSVSLGPKHAAAVTAAGEVLESGANDAGQVAPLRKQDALIVKPSLVESLQMTRVVQVSCGLSHTAALSSNGKVLTWGSNAVGQLGYGPTPEHVNFRMPAAMQLGAGVRAASVVCGHEFTAVLTTRMCLLVCGSEEVVTLDDKGQPRLPSPIPVLTGLPLVNVAAGARHLVVLTAAGTAYAWGKNTSGCCGREFPASIRVPVHLQLPDSQRPVPTEGPKPPFPQWAAWDGPTEPVSLADDVAIVHAACGNVHTVLVTRSGALRVCGSNARGQLGLGEMSPSAVVSAVAVEPPGGCQFVSAQAGEAHTLLLDQKGDVWYMGEGLKLTRVLQGKTVLAIAAGGKHSAAIAPGPLRGGLRREFSMDSEMTEALKLEGLVERSLTQDDARRQLATRTEELFRNPAVWNSLFYDPSECDDLYDKLFSAEESRQVAASAIEKGMFEALESLHSEDARLIYPESVRCLLLYLQCPLFRDWKESNLRFDYRGDLILSLCETFLSLPFEGYKAVMSWATSLYGEQNFAKLLVKPLLAQLERGLAEDAGARARAIPAIVGLLRWFHSAAKRQGSIASPEDFYSDAIAEMNPEALYEDLRRMKNASKTELASTFYLCATPFLFSPRTKRSLLQIEHQIDMVRAATSDLSWDSQNHQFVFDPYFVLAVDRQHLLQQTLQKVSQASPTDLRKALKVIFKGEEGVDAGGVAKEFFQLLSMQLFDVSTGMWSMRFDSNVTWFNGDCTWNDDGFYLVGVLVGLAIHNSILLDVNFPRAVYRKLLGHSLGLEDMVDEEIKSGLQHLLDYDGDDVEDIFCLNFEVTWTDLGAERHLELKPGGANISVTSNNREEYVLLYVKWLLVDSIENQYDAFEKGVMHVIEGTSLDLLRPEELELLVEGMPELDFSALEANTTYEGGYDATSDVVQNFWRFAKNADPETEAKLLKFCTGSSKAPIGGLAELPFKIQRAGPDSMQLPTAHTCFNVLILPDYGADYGKLERLLGRAIMECEGFGLQ